MNKTKNIKKFNSELETIEILSSNLFDLMRDKNFTIRELLQVSDIYLKTRSLTGKPALEKDKNTIELKFFTHIRWKNF